MKTITLNLVGLNGNIYYLLGVFIKQAKREGWDDEEIEEIKSKVTSSKDYDEALNIISERCKSVIKHIDW